MAIKLSGTLSKLPVIQSAASLIFLSLISTCQLPSIAQSVITSPNFNQELPNQNFNYIKVLGEVKHPANYTFYTLFDFQDKTQQPTLIQAIGIAGGITDLADISNVQIYRQIKSGSQIITVNLQQILIDGNLTPNINLQPGDTIVIPTVSQKYHPDNYSSQTIKYRVWGEVRQPGTFQTSANPNLTTALSLAGLIANNSPKNNIQIIRINPNGAVSRIKLLINLLKDNNKLNNYTIYNNDIIIVSYPRRLLVPYKPKNITHIGDVINSLLN
ncbi:MAG TPA: SLBB domain-containing protein [Oculatellaceae cyanobacterium]|jgi:polysaccharide export outer membrane protein